MTKRREDYSSAMVTSKGFLVVIIICLGLIAAVVVKIYFDSPGAGDDPVFKADSPSATKVSGETGKEGSTRQTPSYDVIITGIVDGRKIMAIKGVREVTGLGLKDAKDLVDIIPSTVKKGISREAAESAAAKLTDHCLTVKIKERPAKEK